MRQVRTALSIATFGIAAFGLAQTTIQSTIFQLPSGGLEPKSFFKTPAGYIAIADGPFIDVAVRLDENRNPVAAVEAGAFFNGFDPQFNPIFIAQWTAEKYSWKLGDWAWRRNVPDGWRGIADPAGDVFFFRISDFPLRMMKWSGIDGSDLWSVAFSKISQPWSSISVGGDRNPVVMSSIGPRLIKVDGETGELMFDIVANPVLFFHTKRIDLDREGNIYAIGENTHPSSPFQGLVVSKYDKNFGALLWTCPLPSPTGGPLLAKGMQFGADGSVYWKARSIYGPLTNRSFVGRLDPATGAYLWSYFDLQPSFVAENDLTLEIQPDGAVTMATPYHSGIAICTRLVRLNAQTGAVQRSGKLHGWARTDPLVWDAPGRITSVINRGDWPNQYLEFLHAIWD